MKTLDGTMPDGEKVLSAMRRARCELMDMGEFSQNTLDAISRALLPREMYEKYLG